jgi:hypothetical protein
MLVISIVPFQTLQIRGCDANCNKTVNNCFHLSNRVQALFFYALNMVIVQWCKISKASKFRRPNPN